MEDFKKIKSLLKFYYNSGVEITLICELQGENKVSGKIIKKGLFYSYVVLKPKDNSPIKIFIEDIYCNTIRPSDLTVTSEQKNKKNNNKRDPLSPSLRYEVLTRDKYVCKGCGACGPNVEVEVDHIIPVSRGGKDTLDNLQTLCFKCNRGKGDKVL